MHAEPEHRTGDPPVTLEQFRAELEVFSGPLDLLLHLIKQEEVDIFQVAVSRITERYLAAIRAMELFDVNVAAEFLVVAATLTEMKSKTLLPPAERDEDEQEEDPGAELVRRLIEYKEFKEAADHLEGRARERRVRFARPPARGDAEEEPDPEALLEDLAVWDLIAAFAEVVEQTRLSRPAEIVHSDVPVSVYVEEVLAALREAGGPVAFLDFFRTARDRARIIGVFLAILELFRRGAVHVEDGRGGAAQIRLSLREAA